MSCRFNPHVCPLASYKLEGGASPDPGYLCKQRDIMSAFHPKHLKESTVEMESSP